MTLHELWMVSPQSHVFAYFSSNGRADLREYNGSKIDGERKVLDVRACRYPMYRQVLEVMIEG